MSSFNILSSKHKFTIYLKTKSQIFAWYLVMLQWEMKLSMPDACVMNHQPPPGYCTTAVVFVLLAFVLSS